MKTEKWIIACENDNGLEGLPYTLNDKKEAQRIASFLNENTNLNHIIFNETFFKKLNTHYESIAEAVSKNQS